MTQPMTLPPISPAPAAPAPWRERTLARLVEHVRAVLPVSAVAFVTADKGAAGVPDTATWFAQDELRAAMEPCMDRLAAGRTLLLPRVEAWQAAPELMDAIAAELGRERARGAWASFRAASVIVCPVRGEFGSQIGSLVVASTAGRPLGREQLPTVEALADLAAMALERTDLLEAEGRRARDELRLKRAAEAVSGSLEPAEVYVRVAEHAASVTGATCTLLTRLNARTGEARTAAEVGCSEELAIQLSSLDRASYAHVTRTRSPLVSNGTDAAPLGSVMHAPIELGPRLYGILTVGHDEPGRFDEEALDLLVKLARSSAAAIANAIDFQRERRIARALTLGFVPESLPELPGYETGLLYAPAANEATGGDVYGAWPVGGGDRIAVLVGDVAGKGVETAALSAMVRFFIEARSWDSFCPAAILQQANAMLLGRLPRDTFVTAFLGILSEDSLQYCNAGHLPPLLVRAGSVDTLDSHGLPLGILDQHEYGSSELRLQHDDLVFAHTDGLIEARRSGEMYGADRLAQLVAAGARTQSPTELVRTVHDEVTAWADGISDDAVALALRRNG
jgi:GAF domain-containing protein